MYMCILCCHLHVGFENEGGKQESQQDSELVGREQSDEGRTDGRERNDD